MLAQDEEKQILKDIMQKLSMLRGDEDAERKSEPMGPGGEVMEDSEMPVRDLATKAMADERNIPETNEGDELDEKIREMMMPRQKMYDDKKPKGMRVSMMEVTARPKGKGRL